MTLAVIKQKRIAETFHKLLPRETNISVALRKHFKQQSALRKKIPLTKTSSFSSGPSECDPFSHHTKFRSV